MMCWKSVTKSILAVSIGLLTTGCVDQSYKMIGRECPQVVKYEPPHAITKNYIQSVTLYEGYETRAHFDVMIMSNQMRVVLAQLISAKAGHSAAQQTACLKRQLALNKEVIELYVLSQINNPTHVSLSDKNSVWSLFITAPDGRIVQPFSIKEVTLAPEISALFGYRHIGFKAATCITFPASDITGRRYVPAGATASITFAAIGMSSSLKWTEKEINNPAALHIIRQDDKTIWQMITQLAQPKERDEDYYFC